MTSDRDGRVAAPDNGLPHSSRTHHIAFDNSYVTVKSSEAQVMLHLAETVEPMLTTAPAGGLAGSFEVTEEGGRWVIYGPDSPSTEHFRTPERAARALYHRLVKIFIDSRPDLLWIHAGAASWAGRGMVFCAPSGQGKSTIVAELLDRGWAYCSDEIAPIDPMSATVLPFPLSPYKRVSSVRGHASKGDRALNKIRVELREVNIPRVAVPIERIFFLRYTVQDLRTSLVDCAPGEAVIELLSNSLNPSESRDQEIQQLCSLVRRVPHAFLHYSNAADVAIQIASLRPATVG